MSSVPDSSCGAYLHQLVLLDLYRGGVVAKAPAHRIDTGRTELTLGRGERVEQADLAFPVWLSVRQTAQTRL